MKLWTSLSTKSEDARWLKLAERLRLAGVENEYRPWEGKDVTAPKREELANYHHVRVEPALGPAILKCVNVQTSWITMLGVTDGLHCVEHTWWPACALVEALGQILIERGPEFEMRGNVLVAGTGGLAQAAIAAFFRAGFKKFLITSENVAEAEALIKNLRAHLFGLELELIAMDRIVMLPGESSVLVNGVDPARDPQLLTELSYLNFLRRPGFVFDLKAEGSTSALLTEAREAGIQAIHARVVEAKADALWAEWAFKTQLAPVAEV